MPFYAVFFCLPIPGDALRVSMLNKGKMKLPQPYLAKQIFAVRFTHRNLNSANEDK